jgi:hypothetical protein
MTRRHHGIKMIGPAKNLQNCSLHKIPLKIPAKFLHLHAAAEARLKQSSSRLDPLRTDFRVPGIQFSSLMMMRMKWHSSSAVL